MQRPHVLDSQARLVAGGLLAMGRLIAQIEPRGGLDTLKKALPTISQGGLSQASDESSYDPDDKEPVNLELARRGVGEVGKVAVASSLRHKNIQKSLLLVYTAWVRKYSTRILTLHCPTVQAMLDSITDAGPLKRCYNRHRTSKARVIPKSSQICSLIFACVGINKADVRKPTKFTCFHVYPTLGHMLFFR